MLATLNADSEQDRYKFVMDLQESIFEMDLMERAFREANLIKWAKGGTEQYGTIRTATPQRSK